MKMRLDSTSSNSKNPQSSQIGRMWVFSITFEYRNEVNSKQMEFPTILGSRNQMEPSVGNDYK